MSQPSRAEQHPDSDPLLEFFQEQETPAEPSQTTKDRPADDLPVRLERAERQVERALLEISSLKSDLATLVTAVDDIRKRPSRPLAKPAPPAVAPRGERTRARAVAGIVVTLAAGAGLWGLVSPATEDPPAPLPIVHSASPDVAAPVVMPAAMTPAAPGFVDGMGAAGTGGPARPAAPKASAPAGAAREPRSPDAAYFGTLTVDADPIGDVYLNRQRVGRTPLRLENLRAGSHLIWIEREGYRRFTRVVPVAADRISRVSAALDPISR